MVTYPYGPRESSAVTAYPCTRQSVSLKISLTCMKSDSIRSVVVYVIGKPFAVEEKV